MDIVGFHVMVEKVFRQLLSHTFRQCGYECSFVSLASYQNLVHQVVYLVLAWPYFYFRVKQSCRPYHLFHDNTF